MIEQKTALRVVANTLPVLRAVAGPVIAHKLHNTPPKERTWKFAGAVAVLAATDKLDGWLARRVGSTKLGGWLDQTADKKFLTPSLEVLGDTGEIAPAHHTLRVLRDGSVGALRADGKRRGLDTAATLSGQCKTSLDMAGLVIACSPLSTHSGLVRTAMTGGTIMSLVSGGDRLLRHGQPPEPVPVLGVV